MKHDYHTHVTLFQFTRTKSMTSFEYWKILNAEYNSDDCERKEYDETIYISFCKYLLSCFILDSNINKKYKYNEIKTCGQIKRVLGFELGK